MRSERKRTRCPTRGPTMRASKPVYIIVQWAGRTWTYGRSWRLSMRRCARPRTPTWPSSSGSSRWERGTHWLNLSRPDCTVDLQAVRLAFCLSGLPAGCEVDLLNIRLNLWASRLTGKQSGWPSGCQIDLLATRLTFWLSDWPFGYQVDLLAVSLTCWLSGLPDGCQVDLLSWLSCWPNDCQIDMLAIGWPAGYQVDKLGTENLGCRPVDKSNNTLKQIFKWCQEQSSVIHTATVLHSS